ncbi:MAG: TIGR04283 family arsenosugar biosynthesis glycosyltransferase [Thermoanaerobaculia bacterium]
MRRSVAVVIPAKNEALRVSASIASAFSAGANEVIVVDGGSGDTTRDVAAAAGARVLLAPSMRSVQMNEGARATTCEVIIFLHADTILPENAVEAVADAVATGFSFGGFQLEFIEDDPKLRLAAAMINFRTRITGRPWGDQAQFVDRRTFLESGGFRPIPIMEDYELAGRMKRSQRTVVLDSLVRTSGRRFLEKGLLRTSYVNWKIIAGWHLGRSPEQLAALYRR